MTLDDAIELTAQSLRAYALRYDHWAIAYSGGKDSSALVAVVIYLIVTGRVPKPKSLTVLMSDTRMELPPLFAIAMMVMDRIRLLGFKAEVVMPVIEDRFFVYVLGRGVPPPSNSFRWCTGQLKVEPMEAALKALRDQYGQKFLMLTGVRVGESAARDARIAVSCGKNNSECGQGWFQEATPEDVADTLAPILHWRLCQVWDWLTIYSSEHGFPTTLVAAVYGQDENLETHARTGCIACNLASQDFALKEIITRPQWSHFAPLLRLREVYAEVKKPHNRLRKDGTEKRLDGSLVANPCRMGPLTFEARLWALDEVLRIQWEAGVDLINAEEEIAIRRLIEAKTWPNGWDGTEPLASLPFENVNRDGSVQQNLINLLLVLIVFMVGCATPTMPPSVTSPASNWQASFWLAASVASSNLPPLPAVTNSSPLARLMPPARSGSGVSGVAAPALASVAFVPQPTNLLSFGWDGLQAGTAAGYVLHFGTRSGRYSGAVTNDISSTTATATGLDFHEPWYCVLTAFVSNTAPVIHCVASGSTAICRTNWITESDPSPEIVWMDVTMRPFITEAGGNVTVTGYGALGNHYTVFTGPSPDSTTNAQAAVAFEIDGLNAPWTFQTNGATAGYFRTEVTTP